MTNKTYDVLKFIAQIVLPAVGTLYAALAKVWGFPYGAEIVATITAIDAFLGAMLGISSHQYYKDGKDVAGTITLNPEEETAAFDFDNMTVSDLLNMKVAKVKVENSNK